MTATEPTKTRVWDDAAAAAFARHQRHGTAVARIGAALRAMLGPVEDLLDIGAGPGEIGAALLSPGGLHRCVEPSPWLAQRLARRTPRGLRRQVQASTWQTALADPGLAAEVVLACNIPGLVEDAPALWAALRPRARRALAWVVPAQAGPRSWCLAGFLPPELHREDCTPGAERTLAALAGFAPTPRHGEVAWVWRQPFASRTAATAWCAARLPDGDDPAVRLRLAEWCRRHLVQRGGLWWAEAPKRSAILIWDAA